MAKSLSCCVSVLSIGFDPNKKMTEINNKLLFIWKVLGKLTSFSKKKMKKA